MVCTLLASLGLPAISASASTEALIPRAALLADRAPHSPRISPDGSQIAYLAPDANGVENLWIKMPGRGDDRRVTAESRRSIALYRWAGDSRHLIYERDSDGDELFHAYSVDVVTGVTRDLTPFPGVRVQNLLSSAQRPHEILVGLNKRDPRVFDMYRIDVSTGDMVLDTDNPGDVLSWTTDANFVIRAATAFDPKTGATILRVRDGIGTPWRDVATWSFEDSVMFGQVSGGTVVADFAPDGNSLYVVSAAHSDTAQLVRIDAKSGAELEVLAAHPRSDVAVDPVGDPLAGEYRPLVMTNPETHRLQAVAFEYLTWEWQIFDPHVRDDLDRLIRGHRGFPVVVSRDTSDRRWIFQTVGADAPAQFYLLNRSTRTVVPLFASRSSGTTRRMGRMQAVVIPARDGRALPSYLTLPPYSPATALPMVLYVHGGPWYRDDWGFDPVVQLLANRGYAVLQVNFRGSTGFGKTFLNAGNQQFGLGMQDDLEDGVRWAIARGTADPKRVAIMGYSAGGYATLRGLARTPELFACGVDIVGPSDVGMFLASFGPWMQAVKARWIRRIGDFEADPELGRRLSPLYQADMIRAPLLIGQGAHDPRVAMRQSDQMVAALRTQGLPVEYIMYPDEGHGFAREENNLDFFGRVEDFLAQHLHGRAEPWMPVAGSSAQVR